jgi:CHAT domain-containing protein
MLAMLFRPIRLLVAVSLVALPSAALADPVASIQAARASAARCDIAAALSASLAALGEAQAAWRTDDARLLIVHQDIATFANQALDFRRAETSARAALDMAARKAAPSALEMALVGQNLAVALAGQGKRLEAAALFEQVLAQMSATGTPAMIANAEVAYSDFEYGAGRPASGLRHIEKAAAIAATGAVTPELKATILLRLAAGYRRELVFDKADKALAELAIPGATGPTARLALVRADIAYERGQLTQSLGIVDGIEQGRPAFDACDPTFKADVAQRRGTLHMVRRELPEAAAAFTGALASLSEVKLGDNQRIGEITYGLAVIAGMSKDFDQSAKLFDSAAAAFRRIYGGDSEAEALVLMEKALMLGEAQRPDEAVANARSALAMVMGKVEQAPLTRAYAHASLGLSLQKAGRLRAARRELEIALAAFAQARGAESFDLAPGLRALGTIARDTGDLGAAERYFRRALAIERRWGGDSAVSLGTTLSSLADVLERRRDHAAALSHSAEAVAVLQRRLAIGEARPWNDAQAERIAARSILIGDLALAAAHLAPEELLEDAATVDRMLIAAQLANATTTGSAIAQMTTRLQASSPALGTMLGQRNDLSAEWRSIQDQLVGSLALGGNDSDELRDALLKRQQEVAGQLGAIDRQLTLRDPKLDLLVKSRVVGLGALQAALKPKEALLVFTPDTAATFAIVVTRERAVAFRSALTLARATELVSRIRGALDPHRWAIDLPVFDGEAAYTLYRELIGPAQTVLAGSDEVLTVTEGPLSSLPLSVLLTAPPPTLTGDEDEYKALPWLIRRFAFATYPSVASIVALRGLAATNATTDTMLGVGDPTFAGAPGTALQGSQILRSMAHTRLANVDMLRKLEALPDTRSELMTMASAFAPGRAKLALGAEATETMIRSAPLDRYAMIVFATHGIVAGELSGYAEPALALTPPAVASPQDDGLLSASEVATLNLRSRWVILSACNTAASNGEPSGEPLSGLAKSFFYAGAQSLLVSHWAVDSAAAAKLTSETVALAADGRSASLALRDVELRFIDNSDASYRTHPFYWAPFALIGD